MSHKLKREEGEKESKMRRKEKKKREKRNALQTITTINTHQSVKSSSIISRDLFDDEIHILSLSLS